MSPNEKEWDKYAQECPWRSIITPTLFSCRAVVEFCEIDNCAPWHFRHAGQTSVLHTPKEKCDD